MKLFRINNPSNPLMKNYRRVISASIMAIILLVFISFFVTEALLKYQRDLDLVRENLNKQIQIWTRIERVILLQLDQYNEQAYVSEVLGKKMQSTIAANLHKTVKIEQELETQLNSLSLSFINQHNFEANVDMSIIKSVDKFTKLPHDLLILADQIWDVDIQIQFRSGKYLEALRHALEAVENRKRVVHRTSNMIFICLNIALVIGIILIWRFGLRPAFDRMNSEYREKMSVTSKLAEVNAEFQASFFALDQASVIIDNSGKLLHYNTLFLELLDTKKINRDSDSFFTFLSSLETVSQISSASHVSSVYELTKLCESDHIFIIGARHYSMSCSNVSDNKWIVLLNDHERFMRKKEAELNKKRLETLDYISGGVAHDFNNILGSILSRAELMEMSLADEESITSIRGIMESCERGKVVTSNLLSYARQKRLNKQSMSTDSFFNTLKEQIIVPDNIIFQLENHLDAIIDVDIMQLITAIENLVKNAIDAIGGSNGKIKVSVQNDIHFPHMAAFRVEDDGSGFSDLALKQAPDPFFSTKTLQHGNGLGLSMVAGFISQSSGLLNFGNRDEGGAYVEILLPINVEIPLEIDTDKENITKADKSFSHFDPKSCLIIEDNIEIVNAMELFFSPVFSIIKIATTCQDAEDILKLEQDFDIVICDWTLPDGNSGEIIRNIAKTFPQTLIIITTGNVGKGLDDLTKEVDLIIFEKPASLHQLREKILQEIQ